MTDLLSFDLEDARLPWADVRVPNYANGGKGRYSFQLAPSLPMTGFYRGMRRPEHLVWSLHNNKTKKVLGGTTPKDVEAYMPHIRHIRGNAVMVGVELGVGLFNVMHKQDIERLTICETDHFRIAALISYAGLYEWPAWPRSVALNGLDDLYKQDMQVDYLFVDLPDVKLPAIVEISLHLRAREVSWRFMEYDFMEFADKHLRTTGVLKGPEDRATADMIDLEMGQRWVDAAAEYGISLRHIVLEDGWVHQAFRAVKNATVY